MAPTSQLTDALSVNQDRLVSCVMKRGYDSRQEAEHQNCRTYHCESCGKWHRASLYQPKSRNAKFRHFIRKWNRHAKRLKGATDPNN